MMGFSFKCKQPQQQQQSKKTLSSSSPSSSSNPTETSSSGDGFIMPRELVLLEDYYSQENNHLNHSDDVSSIQVGESVVGGAEKNSNIFATLKSGGPNSSTEELNMLFVVPEEPNVVVVETPTTTTRRRKGNSAAAAAAAAVVTPSPSNYNTDDRKIKNAQPKSCASETTVHVANHKKHKLGISACVYLSLLVNDETGDDKTKSEAERIVQNTLKGHVDLMPIFAEEDESEKKRKRKKKRQKNQLPVDVDDVSFVNESMEQVIQVATTNLKESRYGDAVDVFMGLLAAQRKKANSEQAMATTYSGLTVMHLLRGSTTDNKAVKCATECLKLVKENNYDGSTNGRQHQKQVAISLAELGTAHYAASQIDKAQLAWRESLQIVCKVLGYDHCHVALLLNNLACAHYQNNDYVAALAAFQECLDLQRNSLGNAACLEGGADRALLQISTTLQNMGMVSAKRRQYESAIALLEEGLLVQESVMMEDSRALQIARDYLQRFMQLKDTSRETRQSEHLFVMETLGKSGNSNVRGGTVFGDNDGIPMRTTCSQQDGLDCVLLGSLTDELDVTQRVRETVLAAFSKLSGKDFLPFDLRKTRTSIPVDVDGDNVLDAELHLQDIYLQATAHLKYEEIDEAMDLFESVLRNHKEKYGDVHHLVGTAHHNMGIVNLYAENYSEALLQFQEAVNIRTAALGPDHPDVSAALLKKGIVQLAQQDLDGAHVTFCQVLHLQRKVHGYSHALVAKVLNNIGCVHYEFGGLLASLKAFEEALEIQRRLSGNDNYGGDQAVVAAQRLAIANTLCNVGFVLFKSKEYDRAIVVLQEALDIQRKYLSPGHATTETTMKNLAHVMATCNAIATRDRNATRERNAAIARLTEMYIDMLRCG